jgi:hypothetical protein
VAELINDDDKINDNENDNADAKGASVLERVERFALTTTEALAS